MEGKTRSVASANAGSAIKPSRRFASFSPLTPSTSGIAGCVPFAVTGVTGAVLAGVTASLDLMYTDNEFFAWAVIARSRSVADAVR